MRFLRQSMIGLFLASVALGLLVYAAQLVSDAVQSSLSSERAPPEVRERVFVVNLITAVEGAQTPVLETFGEVNSRRRLELRAAISGRIINLSPAFAEGGSVTAGEVIVSIDPADMQSAYDRLAADLADAKAEVRDADRGLDLAQQEERAAQQQAVLREQALARQVDLAARGVGSAASVETAELASAAAEAVVIARRQAVAQAQARIDQAATRVARAEIALAEAARNLADTVVDAPFSGTLSNTAAVEGGLVAANERLADLIDPSDLEVAFRVSTTQYARLLDEQGVLIDAPVAVRLDANGSDLTATGRINRVSGDTGEAQTGRLVFARLGAAPGFRPGDFVTVLVQEPMLEDVIRLPASAVGSGGEVLVLGQNDRLDAVDVQLVRRQGDDVLVRAEGLAGREVVRERSPLLGAGIAVRPLRSDAEEARAMPALLDLSADRRARLVAFVQNDTQMPEADKAQVLAQLSQQEVPAHMVARLESRMGG
ncbi:efflux transporter periplasmic adaptor subunit [Roseobacter denitrificans]|uniref:Efflux transporter, RND family, MFP subunit, putative n=1 Tax=Roseobacter denitrificans (strain ATCC 33942 / OCh 114) TaxID=375451 RepID=Q163C9_ROSDO|nr:HlyD family efflux transporter periplasmic adaptor subunit [Roseobacter denitrificans]ABG32914.1 efflux transporter, RND family, MFP subunit, putative [Roseobacter denitrificans OCh 114]AVL52305.1 efflux transporter periplasmic adaptor subunit [Roseobacter denitrificans]SFG45804.1 RND family efflux transporter, MFP subunit [Roseobacter denitrificans OCh 114]